MSYPTVNTPYGFKPINRLDFLPYAGATRQYPVTVGEAVYNGQAVILAVGGTVEGSASLASGDILGVCVGVQYTNSTNQTVQAQFAPASGVTNVIAYVVDDPWALYKVAITGDNQTITPSDATIVGTNVAGVIGTGSTTTGNINSSINGSSADDSAALPFRVVSMVPETVDSATGLYTEAIVKLNLSQLLSTTGNVLPA